VTPLADREQAADVRDCFPLLELLRSDWIEPVVGVWSRLWSASLWPTPSACPYNPIAPKVDLVTHVNQVTIGALKLADTAVDVLGVESDRDVVLAAGLLHDASKLVEYEPGPDGQARKSEFGSTHRHAELAAARASEAGLPPSVVDIVRNHTPQSPEIPRTVEGLCIYYADMCAADIARLNGGVKLIVEGHKPAS
jgi:putative nucleotidyltransferase with HDIG domain